MWQLLLLRFAAGIVKSVSSVDLNLSRSITRGPRDYWEARLFGSGNWNMLAWLGSWAYTEGSELMIVEAVEAHVVYPVSNGVVPVPATLPQGGNKSRSIGSSMSSYSKPGRNPAIYFTNKLASLQHSRQIQYRVVTISWGLMPEIWAGLSSSAHAGGPGLRRWCWWAARWRESESESLISIQDTRTLTSDQLWSCMWRLFTTVWVDLEFWPNYLFGIHKSWY